MPVKNVGIRTTINALIVNLAGFYLALNVLRYAHSSICIFSPTILVKGVQSSVLNAMELTALKTARDAIAFSTCSTMGAILNVHKATTKII